MQDVRAAMESGDYERLKECVEVLQTHLDKMAGSSDMGDISSTENSISSVDESEIMEKHGKALREVSEIRDTYNIRACDVCDQFRSDLRSLASYEGLKGFESEKMTQNIELLYKEKTKHEDLDDFLADTLICGYCVDKLRSNKDIARSAFNGLAVNETPDCIKQLNLYERTLIKFCLTCITVVRLSPTVNTFRPNNELTAALKGQIAYLLLDFAANATFMPDKLFDVNSLVFIIGGQPTQINKIWISLVDIGKIHSVIVPWVGCEKTTISTRMFHVILLKRFTS